MIRDSTYHKPLWPTTDRSDPPVWIRSIADTLSTHDRQSLPCTTFSHNSMVEVVGNIRGDNTQTLVDMLDRVSACAFRIWRTGRLTHMLTSACRTGPDSTIPGDPTLLQSNRDPTLSW